MLLKDNPRFVSLKDKKRNYLDTLTGETISKKIADKRNRGGITQEAFAKSNKSKNLTQALARPARGRKSAQKLSDFEKQAVLEARVEEFNRKAEAKIEESKKKAVERLLAKQARKTVKRTRITKSMLRPGSKGARGKFNNYDEYLISLAEAKKTGVIFSYGLGMVGYDENSGENYGITVFTMEHINNPPIPREKFEERFMEERIERQYFVFQYYFIHVAFQRAYYEKVLADSKVAKKAKRK